MQTVSLCLIVPGSTGPGGLVPSVLMAAVALWLPDQPLVGVGKGRPPGTSKEQMQPRSGPRNVKLMKNQSARSQGSGCVC